MANDKPAPTIADYMVIALSPLLIMALVGSLVFFLVAVFYVGDFTFRLDWILFFFVFAAVLIARMSMHEDTSPRAVLYGLALGIPTFIGLQSFVEYPADSSAAAYSWGVNLLLMGIIWWCAHRLTLDCTQVADDEAADGQGLLEAAGLDPREGDEEAAEAGAQEPAPAGWWARYKRYQEERKKRRTPGVWVIYFSLAALPLFGLGQSLIPVAEVERRRYVFWLLVIYVGSGLGLLLTTCFLGLRRYLRQRQVQMTGAMTTLWLTLGGGLIVGLLVLGAILPRPQAEYPLVEMAGLGSKERSASPFAVLRDSPGKGQGQPSSDSPRGGAKEGQAAGKDGSGQPNSSDPKAAQGNAGQRNGSGERNGSGSGNQQGGDKGNQQGGDKGNQQGGQGKQGNGQGNQQGGDKGNNSGAQSGNKANGQGQPSGEKGTGQGNQQSGDKGGKQEGDKGGSQGKQPGDKGGRPPDQNSQQNSGNNGRKPEDQNSGQGKKPDGQPGERKDTDQKQTGSDPGAQPSSSPLASLGALLAALALIMKWIVFGIIVLIVAFLVLRAVLQFLANFTTWARGLLDALRSLWQGLFGWLSVSGKGAEAEAEMKGGPPPRPFSSYSNPFHDGRAGRWPPEKLLRYTFEAFQAWAWERELGRRLDETALEFADRIGGEVVALEHDARRLAVLYARSLYARGPLPATCAEEVEQFWDRLEAVAEQPLSA
jgi:hypothetical protein